TDSFTVAGASAVSASAVTGGNTITLTTTGLTSTSSTPAVNYVAATGDVLDASVATNEVANGGAVAAADGVAPTFTANRTALNTIVLTFSENVDVTTTDGSGYTVAGATVTANSDPAGIASTITLTTTGLTSTSSTPLVTYATLAGTTVDASPATNEVGDGTSASATDGVAPTFTANRTALNTIVLTFSETVTSGGVDTDSFTVAGASAVSASTHKHIFYSSCELRCSNR
ncbi:MAG: hypothetical protein NTX72_04610, partial [Candidatus Uhrbacteria bacterium]|nr:hypothetical protein [Candidatus Uhrbacteria bacterium]